MKTPPFRPMVSTVACKQCGAVIERRDALELGLVSGRRRRRVSSFYCSDCSRGILGAVMTPIFSPALPGRSDDQNPNITGRKGCSNGGYDKESAGPLSTSLRFQR